ncbi:MAG: dynamin family protein [bacterium]
MTENNENAQEAPVETTAATLPVTVANVEDMLTELGEIARETGLATLGREIVEERIPSLQKGRITVVVLGEFNHGKSTVVNALLGEEVLPMGITPTTAVITHLVHGDKARATVKPPMGQPAYDIEFDEIEAVVKHVEESKAEPEYVEIEHPNPFLDNGLVLVDTPGVNDISRQKVEITYGYLPRADVIIYVLDATQVLKKSEVMFIKDRLLKANRNRILFVLGKIDALSPEDAKEVELYARERLTALIGPVELFAFSARDALVARKAGKAPSDAFLKFESYVTEFLNDQRAYIILDSALSGGMRVSALIEQNLGIKRQGYKLEADELETRIQAVHKRLEESRKLISENIDHIDNTVGDIAAAARHNLRTFTQAFAEALPVEIERADAKDVKRYLPLFIQDTFKEFIEGEGNQIAKNLEDLAEEIIEVTNASLRETVESIRDELGMGGDLDLEVDTIAYDVGVFALGAFGVSVFFMANMLVGGLLTLAAPVLAFFLKDKVDTKIKERAREEGVRSVQIAGEKIEEEILKFIHDYGAKLRTFVETAGDRLYGQIEEVLEQIQKERASNTSQEDLLTQVEKQLEATRRVSRMIQTARDRLSQHVAAHADENAAAE